MKASKSTIKKPVEKQHLTQSDFLSEYDFNWLIDYISQKNTPGSGFYYMDLLNRLVTTKILARYIREVFDGSGDE